MLQNKTTHTATEVYGFIVTTPSGALLFTTDPRPGQLLVSGKTRMETFLDFVKFLKAFDLLKGAMLQCCQQTVESAYQEFLVNRMLKNYGVSKLPNVAPEINALNFSSKSGRFNNWLENARRCLGKLAGFFLQNPKSQRQIENTTK